MNKWVGNLWNVVLGLEYAFSKCQASQYSVINQFPIFRLSVLMKIVSFSWTLSAHMSSPIRVFFSSWRFQHFLVIFPTLTLNFSHLRYSVISPISQCADCCEHVHNCVLLTDFAAYCLITSIQVTSVQWGWSQEQLPTSYVIYCHPGSIMISTHTYSTYSLLNESFTLTSSRCLLEGFCVCF